MTAAAGSPAPGLCGNCHSPLTEDDMFCGECGQRVPGGSDVPLSAPAAESDTAVTAAGAGSAVPEPAADMPELLVGVPELPGVSDLPDPYSESAGRSWPAAAEVPHAPAWPGSGAPAQAAEASVGQATPNSTYIGMRLQYEKEPEPSFDPLENSRFLKQLLFRGWVYGLVFFFCAVAAGIFFAVVGAVIGIAALTLYVICAIVSWLVLWCLWWLLPLPVLLSEWKFSVDGKGAAGAMAFEHIAWTLGQRQTPLDSVQVRRLRLPGEGTRDYLELRRGLFLGYIACFPYGHDLYVGWTFYFRLSPLRYLLMFLARIWQTLSNRHTDLYVTLRYDSARAMREAMHSAAREGLDVAIGQLVPQGHGIIGGQIRVTDVAQ